jgi:hypothetical protein
MPKDEFDFEDPLELHSVTLLTDEDNSAGMAECFTEEFLRLGYNHKQVLALFRNPHYTGPNMVLANKGEPFVRDIIAETFARWGRPVQWLGTAANDRPIPPPADSSPPPSKSVSTCSCEPGSACGNGAASGEARAADHARPTDPLGNPAPKLNL